MQRVDPLTYRDWNEHVLALPQASIFHSTNWLRVLQASYGYQPYYFACFKGSQLTALLPFMEVKSWITGVRGVSLPFSDYCEPISDTNTPYLEVLAQVILVARRQQWKSIEMRGGGDLLHGISPSTFYYRHLLMLQKDEAKMFSRLRSNYRARIRKARSSDLTVSILRSSEAMTAYYRLHCLTRKRQGVPPQPARFFQHIQEHLIAKNFGFVALVSHHGTHVAGGVFFSFGHRVIYKFGATDRRYQPLYPTHLLLWHVIQWLYHHDYTELCFGRSASNNTGLIQFKDGWGTNKYRINYYRYNLQTASFVKNFNYWSEAGSKVWQKMPATLLKLAGSVLYKHMG
jgi:Acetyltransferase (GNAT) domain